MNREDAIAVPWMAKQTRNPLPSRIVWKQDNVTHSTFYWLAVPTGKAAKGPHITATLEQQQVAIKGPAGKIVLVRFNDHLINLDRPVSIKGNGKQLFQGRVPRTINRLQETLDERRDPHLMFSAEMSVLLPTP